MTTTPSDTADRDSAAPTSPRPRTLAAAALRAAAAGWAVFPVRPRGKTPAVRDWENVATLDPDRIHAWWARGAWNIGVATGPSGLLVVDLDVPAAATDLPMATGPDPADAPSGGPAPDAAADSADIDVPVAAETVGGAAVFGRLAVAASASSPDTFTVATPSGGRHLYFRQPAGAALRNTQRALGPLIDTRGHGGYVLAAGSRGPATPRYRVLHDTPVAPLPRWLLDALTTPAPPSTVDAQNPAGDEPGRGAVINAADGPMPRVSVARVEAYLRAVVQGESRAVATAPVGTRHRILLRAARRLGNWVGGGALTTAEVHAVLTTAAAGYVGVGGYTARQVERDITDGLVYGAARPRHIDDLPDRSAAHLPDTGR